MNLLKATFYDEFSCMGRNKAAAIPGKFNMV